MHKSLDFFISRRTLLKASALSLTILTLPAWSTKVIAQTSNAVPLQAGSPKPDGLVSFNAGWMIPVEDQKALLALEVKKNQEAQAATPKANQNPEAGTESSKSTKKSWTEKLQDKWKQVKDYF